MLSACRVSFLCVFALALAGCASAATNVSTGENDPYESFNRKTFALNESMDKHVARPIAVFYTRAVPGIARDGIHNFLTNLGMPVTFINDVLQGEPKRAVDTFGRFVVNSSAGVGGLVDVAQKTGIPEHTSDFGETLGVYGVEEGPFLVLPLLGPSNPRDAFGYGADVAMDPMTWVTFRSSDFFKLGKGVAGIIDERAQNIDTLDQLERTSLDLYATERSLYRQHRQAEINHGKPNIEDLPNF
ncbi:MAG: VacJ family lipoprotein [Rhizomicrobium sp.]|jgi:phospholipid-binding lipoprotein MlaA